MGASNYQTCCGGAHNHQHPYMALSGIRDRDLVIEQIDKLKDQEFSEELFKVAHESITKSIGSVFNDVDYGHEDYELMNDLKRDTYKFAAFKAANFSHTMKVADADEKDSLMRAFEVQLDSEVTTATRAARSAKQWQQFEANANEYPNLEYLESRSADKNDEHRKYYGLILPLNHSFWNGGLPPNNYGCKCRAGQTDKKPTEGKVDHVDLPKGIVGNAFKERKVFADDHSFYSNLNKKGRKTVMDHHDALAVNIPYPKAMYESKGKVFVHDLYHKDDIGKNIEHAKYLADTGLNVKIRPHGTNIKNPEYLINGKVSDLKTNEGKNLSSLISAANDQGCREIVFEMDQVKSPYDHARELANKVNGTMMQHYSGAFDGFWIIDKQKVVSYWKARKKVAK